MICVNGANTGAIRAIRRYSTPKYAHWMVEHGVPFHSYIMLKIKQQQQERNYCIIAGCYLGYCWCCWCYCNNSCFKIYGLTWYSIPSILSFFLIWTVTKASLTIEFIHIPLQGTTKKVICGSIHRKIHKNNKKITGT